MKKYTLSIIILAICLGLNAQTKETPNKTPKFGFINPRGKLVIPLIYEEVSYFNEGFAVVLNNKKELLIVNKEGKETPIKNKNYDQSFPYKSFVFSEGLCAIMFNKKFGFINTKGVEVIPCEYDVPKEPKDADLRTVKYAPKFVNGMAVIYQNGLYGVINKTGKIIVPIEYQFITHFKNNLAVFKKDLTAKGMYGVMDISGKVIVNPTKFLENIWIEDKNIIRYHYVDGKWSNFYDFYDNKGIEIKKGKHYPYLSEFENGFALYGEEDAPNFWGIVDAMGNKKPLTEKYAFNKNEPSQFRNGYLYAQKVIDKKMVVLNDNGERVNNNCEYDYIYELSKDGIAYGIKGTKNASFYNDKQCSLIYETDKNGVGSINYIMSSLNRIYPFKGDYAAIRKDDGDPNKRNFDFFLIDKKGKITYEVKGGMDCSLKPDETEIGIYIYNKRDFLDLNAPAYVLYLNGGGTVIYKGGYSSRNFNDGLAAVSNYQ